MTPVLVGSGLPACRRASARRVASHAHLWVLFAAVALYLSLALAMSAVKTPLLDEFWIPAPAANWARAGSWGTPSLEPTGSWLDRELTGIHQYTYANFPVALFFHGLWYKVFGFSLFSARSVGILFGLLALGSWAMIVGELTGSRIAGSLTALLLALDYTYLWTAADGRMDMMCVGFGAAGIACYLVLRERRWTMALWFANALLALSLFTHPNGIMPVLTFFVLLFWLDGRRLSWRDFTAVIPYLVIAAVWELYILRRPDLFLAQFSANANPYGGFRFSGLIHPLEAFRTEFVTRYLFHYGFRSIWGGPAPGYALAIPVLYWLSLIAAGIYAVVHRCRSLLPVIAIAGLNVAYMTFFVGAKASCYLVYVLPLYAAVLAAWTCHLHQRGSALAPASLLIVLALLSAQIGSEVYKIRLNTYANEYLPVVRFVEHRHGTVAASTYFGFQLGFERLRDDGRLGYYSGVHTDIIVEDLWYRRWWNLLFEPEVHRYVADLIDTEYRIVYDKGPYRVYERRGM